MEFSRPEYWSGYPISSPIDLPDPGIKPGSPILQADTLPAELLSFTLIFHYFSLHLEPPMPLFSSELHRIPFLKQNQ